MCIIKKKSSILNKLILYLPLGMAPKEMKASNVSSILTQAAVIGYDVCAYNLNRARGGI